MGDRTGYVSAACWNSPMNSACRRFVAVIQQWAGQPIPYHADGLFSLALWGPSATPTHLIAVWTFEKDGRKYLAVSA